MGSGWSIRWNGRNKFFNMIGNKFFGLAFTWLLGSRQRHVGGTKVLFRAITKPSRANRSYLGTSIHSGISIFFRCGQINLRIIDLPSGTQLALTEHHIQRWQHGWLLCAWCYLPPADEIVR